MKKPKHSYQWNNSDRWTSESEGEHIAPTAPLPDDSPHHQPPSYDEANSGYQPSGLGYANPSMKAVIRDS